MDVILATISLITALITAITAIMGLGPMVIERRWTTAEPFAAMAQLFSDTTMNIIRSTINDLQNRVYRLEDVKMKVGS